MIHVKIKLDIFGTEVHFIISNDLDQVYKLLKKITKSDPSVSIDLEDTNGLAFGYGMKFDFIWMKEFDISDPFLISILSHEIIHVTWSLNDKFGLNIDSDHDEIQAYFHSHILENLLIKIKKWQKTK